MSFLFIGWREVGGGVKVAVNVLNRRYYYQENKAGIELSDIWEETFIWGLFAGRRKSHLAGGSGGPPPEKIPRKVGQLMYIWCISRWIWCLKKLHFHSFFYFKTLSNISQFLCLYKNYYSQEGFLKDHPYEVNRSLKNVTRNLVQKISTRKIVKKHMINFLRDILREISRYSLGWPHQR